MSNDMGTSSRTMSEHVLTSHHNGLSERIYVFDPNEKDQGILGLPTLESFYAAGGPHYNASTSIVPKHSVAMVNDQNAQTWPELVNQSITYTESDRYFWFSTSGRTDAYLKEDLAKYGNVTNPEESMDRIDGLFAKKPSVGYVKLPPKSQGFIVFPEKKPEYSRYSAMTDVDLYVRKAVPYGDMRANDVGNNLSKTLNGELRVRGNFFINQFSERPNYDPETGSYTIFRERALNWANYIMTNDIDGEMDLKGFGVVDLSDENALGATIYRSILTLAEDLESVAWRRAEALGLSGREAEKYVEHYINSVIEHEEIHFGETDGISRTASETRAGKLQSSFYSEQAKLREGTIDGKMYSILARHYAAYEEAARRGEMSKSKSLSKLEELAKEYRAEAVASGIEDVANYVDRKLGEYVREESEENDAEKSVLEKLIDESPELREAIDGLEEDVPDYEMNLEYAENVEELEAPEAEAVEA